MQKVLVVIDRASKSVQTRFDFICVTRGVSSVKDYQTLRERKFCL